VLNRESETQITYIGTRHGEKVFESLLSQEERGFAQESKEYFKVPLDTRSLDYEVYFEKGEVRQAVSQSFNSHNTHQMNIDEVADLLENNSEFKKLLDSHK
jgi:UDP-glucose 4-epimerase